MSLDLTPDDLHGFVLQSAFRSMASRPELVNIRSRDNKVVSFNRDVLILFSRLVRSILSELPCSSSSPVILLPGTPASVLRKLQDILHQGFCDEALDVQEASELLDAAGHLGLDIKKFYIGKEKKSGAVKEALVNLDNVKNNSNGIKNVIDQKRKEGNQVVLMKTTKSRGINSTPVNTTSASSSLNIPPTPTAQPSLRPATEPSQSSQHPLTQPEPRHTETAATAVKTAPPSAAADPPPSSSSMVSPLSLPVKQERGDEGSVAAAPEPMEEDSSGGPRDEPLPSAARTKSQQSPAPARQTEGETEPKLSETNLNSALNYQCEVKNCNKPFSTVILLKYHYCSHFMSMLKKNHEHLLDNSNSCKDCKKNFQNSRRLLLHIGVNHDKINEILRSRGYKELPPHSSSLLQQAVASKAAEKAAAASAAEKGVFDVRKILDVKNVPLVPTPRRTSESDSVTSQSSSGPSSSSSPSSCSASLESSTVSSVSPPGPPAPSDSSSHSSKSTEEKDKDEVHCNYELECQVCKQKMNTLNLLEQHCCRHFMKELAEQFSALMEDLRCGLCNSVFKQKHKLLLHIGCKHGKINEILKQKGFSVLPAPVLSSSNHAMQKQLIQIKKERMDKEDSRDADLDFVKESGAKTRHVSSSSTASDSSQASTVPTLNPGPFSSELSEILKKYTNLTQPSV